MSDKAVSNTVLKEIDHGRLLNTKRHIMKKNLLNILIRIQKFQKRRYTQTYDWPCLGTEPFIPETLKYWAGVQRGHSYLTWEALVGHPSSDGVTIKMPYGVDVLHRPALHPIFFYWVG